MDSVVLAAGPGEAFPPGAEVRAASSSSSLGKRRRQAFEPRS